METLQELIKKYEIELDDLQNFMCYDLSKWEEVNAQAKQTVYRNIIQDLKNLSHAKEEINTIR